MFTQAFMRCQVYTQQILRAIKDVYENRLYVQNFFEFLELEPTITSPPLARPVPQPIRVGVRFENVTFEYPQQQTTVLENINFEIRPGEIIALVGGNGAGKTTLIKLLCRLYDPTKGQIFIDGLNLKTLDLSDLRAQITIIFQDYVKYCMMVKENICLTDSSDLAPITAAAEKSGAHDFIKQLRCGYHTMLGRQFEDGVELSGGEWQKLALARAFAREDAQILVLDEPTASLDAKTEYQIFKHLRHTAKGKTVILISHRFSNVHVVERILVLQKGRILEQGTHQELMDLGGEYAFMYKMQANSYRLK